MKHSVFHFSFCILLFAFCISDALRVPLTVKETAGIARADAPVQTGVPLPAGAFQPADLGKFMVLDSVSAATGNEVPSDFTVNATWRDGSIRFLNVQFRATVPSKSSKIYYLTDLNANTMNGGFTVTGTSGTIEVETGVLKFKVKGTNFNLIDEAFVDLSGNKDYSAANQIVQAGHNGGFVINGQRSSGGNATVTLYRHTTERAVIKAEGTVGSFPYIVYITAFRGKPYVHITHNFYYNNSTASASINLQDVSLELPTLVTGARTVTAGNSVAQPEAAFSQTASEAAYVVSLSADKTTGCYNIYKGTAVQATGGSAGNVHVGWMQSTAGTKGIGFGIRFFWEMHPKVIEMTAGGTAKLGLYSYKASPLQYYAGGGRTHTAVISFGNDAANAKEGFYNLTQPLYAIAPQVWYCGMTKCLGDLIHDDPLLLAAAADPMFNAYRYFLQVTMKRAQAMNGPGNRYAPIIRNEVNPVSDLFGFICFGDNTDPTNGYCPNQQHYSDNYYDYPHVCLLSLAMNAEKEALTRAWECDLQMADVGHYNTTGDSRGCPVVEHWYSYQNPTGSTCDQLVPWGNANHWKTQSLFENFWFTGEPILVDLGKRINRFVKNNNGAITTGQARSAGHVLMGLSLEYETEWDITVRDRMRWFWNNGVQSFSNSCQTRESEFLNPVVMEGLMYAIRCDPDYVNWRTGMTNLVTSLASAYNYAEHITCQSTTPDLSGGDLLGFAWALDSVPSLAAQLTGPSNDLHNYFFSDASSFYKVATNRQKLYVEMTKAICHWLHRKVRDPNYLSGYPDYLNGTMSTLVDGNGNVVGDGRGLLAVYPNPFYASIVISWSNSGIVGAINQSPLRNAPKLAIYDPNGRMVHRIADLKPGSYSWNVAGLPSGLYIVRLTVGSRSFNKPVMLLK